MAWSLHAWSPGLSAAWDRASTRERKLIVFVILVVIAAAGWSWLWQPILADLARMQRVRTNEQQVLATARAQANELVALQRTSGGAKSGDPRAAVERALAERGLRSAVLALDSQDGRVRVTLSAVRFDALIALLDTLGKDQGLRAAEAVLAARVEPGTVRAELTLSR